MQGNKCYAVIREIQPTSPGGQAFCTYSVLAPDNTNASVVGPTGGAIANFEYGDSNERIRQIFVTDIRSREGDPDLDVNFITG